jgi:CHAT domain-containing protein
MKNFSYAQTLNTLALVIQKTGNFSSAEKKYKEALYVIDSCCGGKKLNEYWDISNNLASLYFDMANYKAAENIHRQVLPHIIDKFHKKIVDYASTLTLLANDYNASGEYDSALYVLKEASGILLKELGNDHPDYATNINSIGSTYEKLGMLDSAEVNYNNVLKIREKKLGMNNPAYAETLTNLGRIALKKKNFNAAESNFKQAEKIRFDKWGQDHPDYAESLNDLASLYYTSNNYNEWSRSIGAAINSWKNSTMHLLLSFGEKEKQTYLDNHLSQRDILLSMLLYFNKHNNTDSLHSYYFRLVTALQGWLLSGSQELNKLVSQKKDTSLILLYNNWLSVKNKYAYAIQLSKKEQEKVQLNSDSLQQLAADMEKLIIEKLPDLLQSLNNTAVNPSYVAAKLKQNEVLINWVSFRYKNPEHWTDSVLYAAFLILPNDSIPKFVSAFDQKKLKALLVNYFNYSGRGVKVKSTVTKESIGVDLYKLVWKPLVPYLKNASKVFIIPAGLLNKISFQSIEDTLHKTLLETVEVHLLNNTNELNNVSSTAQNTKTISLFGGANFDSTLSGRTIDLHGNKTFNFLKGSDSEVKQLDGMFHNNSWSTTLYFGTAASEKNLKDLSGKNSPEILHIATHGFYLDSNATSYKDRSAFPLLRSGFVLSGANIYWDNDNSSASNEDGIITAQEISNLNFSNTKLVTLSACETALGDINNNEGVYGLQRAFKIAGVKEMLITLWSIDDKVTTELMNFFYQHILSGDSYYEALRKAQLTVKEKHPNPALWAGFELLGE